VIIATPIDLRRVVQINRPCQRVTYELQEIGRPTLLEVLRDRFGEHNGGHKLSAEADMVEAEVA